MTRYRYPDDVERWMDAFAAENPNAGWREYQREFERAMLTSMKVGGDLFEKLAPHEPRNDRRR